MTFEPAGSPPPSPSAIVETIPCSWTSISIEPSRYRYQRKAYS